MNSKQSQVGHFKVVNFGDGQLVVGAAHLDQTIVDVHQTVVTAFGSDHLHYVNHVLDYKFNDGIAISFARLCQAGDEHHEVEVRIAVTPGFRRIVTPGIVARRPSWVKHADPAAVITSEKHAAIVATYAFSADNPHAGRISYCTGPMSKVLGVTTRRTLVSFPETDQPIEPESMPDYIGFYLEPDPLTHDGSPLAEHQRPYVTHETQRVRLPTLTPLPLASPDCTAMELPRLVFDPNGTVLTDKQIDDRSMKSPDDERGLSRLYYLESVVRAGWEKAQQCLADAGLPMV